MCRFELTQLKQSDDCIALFCLPVWGSELPLLQERQNGRRGWRTASRKKHLASIRVVWMLAADTDWLLTSFKHVWSVKWFRVLSPNYHACAMCNLQVWKWRWHGTQSGWVTCLEAFRVAMLQCSNFQLPTSYIYMLGNWEPLRLGAQAWLLSQGWYFWWTCQALGHPPELPLLGFASRSRSEVLFWGSRLILLMDMSSPWSPARTAIARICQSEWGFVLGIKVDTSDGHVKPLVTRQNCHC